jgi:hypothetical protein
MIHFVDKYRTEIVAMGYEPLFLTSAPIFGHSARISVLIRKPDGEITVATRSLDRNYWCFTPDWIDAINFFHCLKA